MGKDRLVIQRLVQDRREFETAIDQIVEEKLRAEAERDETRVKLTAISEAETRRKLEAEEAKKRRKEEEEERSKLEEERAEVEASLIRRVEEFQTRIGELEEELARAKMITTTTATLAVAAPNSKSQAEVININDGGAKQNNQDEEKKKKMKKKEMIPSPISSKPAISVCFKNCWSKKRRKWNLPRRRSAICVTIWRRPKNTPERKLEKSADRRKPRRNSKRN